MTGPRAAYSERTGRMELGLCLSRVYANASSCGEMLTRIEQIGNLRDGRDSPEGEHRGLGSREGNGS